MPPTTNMTDEAKNVIEQLKELTERGESNIDIAVRVLRLFRKEGKANEALFAEFNSAWVDYYNGEIDEFPQELLERVVAKLKTL